MSGPLSSSIPAASKGVNCIQFPVSSYVFTPSRGSGSQERTWEVGIRYMTNQAGGGETGGSGMDQNSLLSVEGMIMN